MKLLDRALRNVSIRWKVVAIMLNVAAISLLLAGAGLLWHTRLAFERQTQEEMQLLADVIGVNSTAALTFNDHQAASETLVALRSDPRVLAGGLYDEHGQLFAYYVRPGADVRLPNASPAEGELTLGHEQASLARAVYLKDRPIGRVYLAIDMGQWTGTLWGFIGILATLFAAVLSVGFLVAVWLQRVVTEPIAELAQLMRRVGRERDLQVRAVKRGNDELGVLADGFNDMLDEIGKRRDELEQARDELKQRVAALDSEMIERRRIEVELRYSREQIANFIENANIGLHWVGPDGIIQWANRYELQMLGYSAEEYIGRPIADFHGNRSVIDDMLARLARHEVIEECEAQLRRKDGSICDVLISSSVYWEDDNFVHTRGFTRDITGRKRAEAAVRQSEERYRMLVAATTSVVFSLDARGRVLDRSPSWEAYTGQKWEDYADVGGFSAAHPDDRETAKLRWRHALHACDVFEMETRFWHARTQSYRFCTLRMVPLHQTDGTLREWVGTVTDVDDRKRAEEQFRMAVEAAPNSMIMVDENGHIVLTNRQTETLFGYAREELIGQPLDLLVPDLVRGLPPDQRDAFFVDPPLQAAGPGRELHGRRKDGRQIPIEIGLNPFTSSDGQFCLAAITDITERKRAEQELRRYTDELQRSNRELAQFAYVASHDLQEPLRAISGCVQLLQQRYQQKLDGRADELIEHAVSGAVRMQALINDLLSYSRVGTRGKPFEPCDVSQPLDEALANLAFTIKESGARVTYDEMPVVSADPTQLTQLFQNLIGNALKFRGKESPYIHVGTERKSGGHIIYVRDNGIGIEPQYFERIFGVFQRLHGRNQFPGNGIGLAICRKIVERHYGRIWVESVAGRGATFYFTLPGGGVQNEQSSERYSHQH
ncbi:MAG: PAS domain S-box protein [Gammaproteobacteria bacterium]|nr:PAS domain S-box protein [Gammaproteobacteria bacterium]